MNKYYLMIVMNYLLLFTLLITFRYSLILFMSFGKNPKNFSKGRKGIKKKTGDRFLKKEWWTIRAPGMFSNRNFTKSPVNPRKET